MFSQCHLFLLIKCQKWEDEDREIQSEKSSSENTHTALSVGKSTTAQGTLSLHAMFYQNPLK